MKRYAIFGFILVLATTLWGQTPEMFRYQGRLVDGANLVNATLPMSFKLYDALTDGTLLYEDSSSVLVVDGLYSTTIGDDTISGTLTDALTNATVYLELTIDGETLSPRERVVSVPYAMNASGHTHEVIINLYAREGDSSQTNVLAAGDCYVGSSKAPGGEWSGIQVENSGDGVLIIDSFEFSEPVFSAAIERSPYDGPIPLNKVPAFSRRSVHAYFSPTSAEEYSATLTVHGNQISGTNTLICTGRGLLPARYIDHGDGTVTDLDTGLMWSENANHGKMIWSDAVAYCDNLVTNGYSDWRLPSVAYEGGSAELDTLFRVDGLPAGEWEDLGHPFGGIEYYSTYWSSILEYSEYAYSMQIYPDGTDVNGYSSTNSAHRVWPVRGGE